nr:hypothetical protein Iba_chr14fCG14520 [Ipomoea batatas]
MKSDAVSKVVKAVNQTGQEGYPGRPVSIISSLSDPYQIRHYFRHGCVHPAPTTAAHAEPNGGGRLSTRGGSTYHLPNGARPPLVLHAHSDQAPPRRTLTI